MQVSSSTFYRVEFDRDFAFAFGGPVDDAHPSSLCCRQIGVIDGASVRTDVCVWDVPHPPPFRGRRVGRTSLFIDGRLHGAVVVFALLHDELVSRGAVPRRATSPALGELLLVETVGDHFPSSTCV